MHLARGAITIALVYPLISESARLRLRQRWSQGLLDILGIELQHGGANVTPGCMLVANHVSWVDIFVINALSPTAFVSKHEVRSWPVIGWLAARSETVFLHRGSRGHAKIVNAEIAGLLDAGRNVAVFPEGTTTDGSQVLHFHAALLQPAIEAGHPLQALALRYCDADGNPSRAPAYDGELSMGECLRNILSHRRLMARVAVNAPIPTTSDSRRRELALSTRNWIADQIGAAAQPASARNEAPMRVEATQTELA